MSEEKKYYFYEVWCKTGSYEDTEHWVEKRFNSLKEIIKYLKTVKTEFHYEPTDQGMGLKLPDNDNWMERCKLIDEVPEYSIEKIELSEKFVENLKPVK